MFYLNFEHLFNLFYLQTSHQSEQILHSMRNVSKNVNSTRYIFIFDTTNTLTHVTTFSPANSSPAKCCSGKLIKTALIEFTKVNAVVVASPATFRELSPCPLLKHNELKGVSEKCKIKLFRPTAGKFITSWTSFHRPLTNVSRKNRRKMDQLLPVGRPKQFDHWLLLAVFCIFCSAIDLFLQTRGLARAC